MKSDNYILFIIFIVTLIMISLLKECNKDRLKELENDTIKNIIEEFYHLGSAAPSDSGEWGYQITGITEGKYGGRSKQEVLDNIGNHNIDNNNYISETEKQEYGSYIILPSKDKPKPMDYKDTDNSGICNKYYIIDKLNNNNNKDSKIYAKKVDIYEGVYGGNLSSNNPSYFKVKNFDNSQVNGQDEVNNDGIIRRFRRCNSNDIEDNPNLGISDNNIINERKKSLQITFRRVWSNNLNDITQGDDENHSIYDNGITKWKVEIDDGNWEGLQISDFDKLNFVFGSVNQPLSDINNKYILKSTKDNLKEKLSNFLTNNKNKDDIKKLLNFNDVEFNVIKSNLYTDDNPGNFVDQNCDARIIPWLYYTVGVADAECCTTTLWPSKRFKYYWKEVYNLYKHKSKLYNGKHCSDQFPFTSDEIKNLGQGGRKQWSSEIRVDEEWTNCHSKWEGQYDGECSK
jgi:hypothetical protein